MTAQSHANGNTPHTDYPQHAKSDSAGGSNTARTSCNTARTSDTTFTLGHALGEITGPPPPRPKAPKAQFTDALA